MRKLTFGLILFVLAVFISQGQTLVMGAGDEATAGFSTIFADLVGELGYDVKVEIYPAGRSLEKANAGELDGELLRVAAIADQYPNLRIIGVPMTEIVIAAYTKKGYAELSGPADLAGKKVAVSRNAKAAMQVSANANQIFVQNEEQGLKMVNAGRADIFVGTATTTDSVLANLGLPDVLKQNTPMLELGIYNWLHKKHEALVPKIEELLRQWREDGTLERKVNEFISGI